jgi:hypothetical protein
MSFFRIYKKILAFLGAPSAWDGMDIQQRQSQADVPPKKSKATPNKSTHPHPPTTWAGFVFLARSFLFLVLWFVAPVSV